MPFVKRDNLGNIISISEKATDGFEEEIASDADDLQAFIKRNLKTEGNETLDALRQSDSDIARVTEDLIHMLIEKKLIIFTELPEAVQTKLLQREKLRASLSSDSPGLLDDEGSI